MSFEQKFRAESSGMDRCPVLATPSAQPAPAPQTAGPAAQTNLRQALRRNSDDRLPDPDACASLLAHWGVDEQVASNARALYYQQSAAASATPELLDLAEPAGDSQMPTSWSSSFHLDTSDLSSALNEPVGLAAMGTREGGQPLPFFAELQQAFGLEHDLSTIQAFIGGPAAQAAQSLGARAYCSGESVVFLSTPDLYLVAHEVTHVLQQRAGSGVAAGLGAPGDAHEQQANQVAARVVSGRSAADLLPRPAAPVSKAVSVQRDLTAEEGLAIKQLWVEKGKLTIKMSEYSKWRKMAMYIDSNLISTKTSYILNIPDYISKYEAHEKWKFGNRQGTTEPTQPVIPKLLESMLGNPPTPDFKNKRTYTVQIPDEQSSIYNFSSIEISDIEKREEGSIGIFFLGTHIIDKQSPMWAEADVPDSDADARLLLPKVSKLEGGFDSLNTWDSEFVSSGFIQFTAHETGNYSLFDVLSEMKRNYRYDFEIYFRAFGVDVTSKSITVVDLDTGKILVAKDAVQKIRTDKRLSAVFIHAGQNSSAYQKAQLYIAYKKFYSIVDDTFSFKMNMYELREEGSDDMIDRFYIKNVTDMKSDDAAREQAEQEKTKQMNDKPGLKIEIVKISLPIISAKHSEVMKSQAGKLALVDRAVHTGLQGAKDTFVAVCKYILEKHKETTSVNLTNREKEIIVGDGSKDSTLEGHRIQHRIDVLAVKGITKPS